MLTTAWLLYWGQAGVVGCDVHDNQGNHGAGIADGKIRTLDWDGCNESRRLQAAGLYLVRLGSGGIVAGTRLVMLP